MENFTSFSKMATCYGKSQRGGADVLFLSSGSACRFRACCTSLLVDCRRAPGDFSIFTGRHSRSCTPVVFSNYSPTFVHSGPLGRVIFSSFGPQWLSSGLSPLTFPRKLGAVVQPLMMAVEFFLGLTVEWQSAIRTAVKPDQLDKGYFMEGLDLMLFVVRLLRRIRH